MEIGIHLVGSYQGRSAGEWDELRQLSRVVEDIGATHLFLGENHLTISELSLRMLEAGRATSHLKVGPGATNIVFRHETSLLSTMCSVVDLVGGGRIFLGLGAGDTAFRMMNIRPTSATAMKESILHMRSLLQGGSVDYNGRAVSMPSLPELPIYVFGEGPKMMAAAVQVSDVVVYGGGTSPEAVGWAKNVIEENLPLRLSGLAPVEDWYCVMVSIGETEDEARERISTRMANRAKHNMAANPDLVPEQYRDEAKRLISEFSDQYWDRSNGKLVTPYMFNRFGAVGTLGQVRDQLQKLPELGVERLMIDLPLSDVEEGLKILGSEVLPDLIG